MLLGHGKTNGVHNRGPAVRVYLLALFLICVVDASAFDKQMVKDAKRFAKEAPAVNWDLIRSEEFISEREGGMEFDPHEFKDKEIPDNEIYQFASSEEIKRNVAENRGFDEDERFIRRSEELLEKEGNIEEEYQEEGIYETRKCRKSGEPFPIAYNRKLEMDVHYEPEVKEELKICLGHHKRKHYSSHSTAKKKYDKKYKELSNDTSLQSYDVDLSGGGVMSKYSLRYSWIHKNNNSSCDNFHLETRVSRAEKLSILNERWSNERTPEFELAQTQRCTLIDQSCLEADATKLINGKEIRRNCWRERLTFLCTPEKLNECSFLKSGNCDEVGRTCLRQGPFGCELWELSYRCLTGVKRHRTSTNPEEVQGRDNDIWDTECQVNDAFPEVATKLAVFEQIKDEIAKTEKMDATKISIFKGNKKKCEKSEIDNIFFDCCFSMRGLATELQLSHCTADELALADARAGGRCHFIGEKTIRLGGVKAGRKYIYCCFPSKLARVFQEKSRDQLGIGWGDKHHPNCAGLQVKDLSCIDFTKIDLTEVYEDAKQRTGDLQQKLEKFQNRLVEELESERGKFEKQQGGTHVL